MSDEMKTAKTPKPKAAKVAVTPEKGVITGPAGFALMRLAKKSGVYEFYRELIKKTRGGSKEDYESLGLEITFGISERLVDCETEFWEAASLVYNTSVDEAKNMNFEEVLAGIVPELMEPGMISFFSKTQAASGK